MFHSKKTRCNAFGHSSQFLHCSSVLFLYGSALAGLKARWYGLVLHIMVCCAPVHLSWSAASLQQAYLATIIGLGQVGPSIPEAEVLAAFSKFGRLSSYRFIRKSNTAFMDYEHVAAAAAARATMDGACFGPWSLRVEFKARAHLARHSAPACFSLSGLCSGPRQVQQHCFRVIYPFRRPCSACPKVGSCCSADEGKGEESVTFVKGCERDRCRDD